jgi:hypothetical protein
VALWDVRGPGGLRIFVAGGEAPSTTVTDNHSTAQEV